MTSQSGFSPARRELAREEERRQHHHQVFPDVVYEQVGPEIELHQPHFALMRPLVSPSGAKVHHHRARPGVIHSPHEKNRGLCCRFADSSSLA
jgi:hypothetical protein